LDLLQTTFKELTKALLGCPKTAYQGHYTVTGNHIDYKDDTGFTADGEFRNGILYHAGMILYKEN